LTEQSSEEKTLAPSQKKLRDARQKGQVPRSLDLMTGFTILAGFAYLLITWTAIRDRLAQMLDVIATASGDPFPEVWQGATRRAWEIIMMVELPLVSAIAAASVIAGFLATLGPVFAVQALKPDFNRVSPITGLKRIFSLRNLVAFLASIVKIGVLAAAFWLTLRTSLQTIFEAPVCAEECLGGILVSVLQPLAITAIVMFLIIGFFDLILQRQLFIRDMRMTKAEYKREHKDLEGDPLIRREQRRLRRNLSEGGRLSGTKHATIIIHGPHRAIGLRFAAGETPVPVIVSNTAIGGEDTTLAELRRLGIPVIDDAGLADALARQSLGEFIAQHLFQPIADIFIREGRT
jgi:type III secretion protein U